ncbi:ABC transporter ATP-binding protein [Rhodoplanes sp. Z2-YC6860]|uniref:ABC transporter ATP-binding protein n=1 Tax=Rhodoplanes sp. Z2-YC6860 TaxID=674703 RepID=UPI00078BE217|nr:ABC transporter ATP-binding protein [Rhodoplanes sp. Z2-YC6860]AMN44037.1 oligopeptide/dipeptide ABC transporter ATPase [Rhodoplanes sp. Z2-YC6860]
MADAMTASVARPAPDHSPVLSVRDLVIEVPGKTGLTRLVDGASFDVFPHEVFGIAGESGSGKSMTMLAVMGLLPDPVRMTSGEVILRGRELTRLSFEDMRKLRGKTMSMIFQDPMTSLNPVLRVGAQIAEAIRLHNSSLSKIQVRSRAVELLNLVGIPDPERRLQQYPNEFSGGMRQRVMIAIAMANDPDLLIADEPTTALDVTIQAQVLDVLARVRARTGAAMVLITHDLGLMAESADRVAVMYGGRMMERASVGAAFAQPRHPYTVGLISSLPRLDRSVAKLYSIPGQVPDLARRPSGCVFHPRCGLANDRADCRERAPAFREIGEDHRVACHFAEETVQWSQAIEAPSDVKADPESPRPPATSRVLEVVALRKDFHMRRRKGWGSDTLSAVRDVSFSLTAGRTLGLVGESGCGKSTLGRLILRLINPSGGTIRLQNDDITTMRPARLRPKRRELQVVFQDPYASLDPRMTVHEVIAEPLRINGRYNPNKIGELLAAVGMPVEAAQRRPPEFSGGQRQRIAIARALALEPDVMILDEAVSALDVSIQAQVINLLKDLQHRLELSYLFISHDLSVVHHISDDVAVMYLGKLVEVGSRDQVFRSPAHPYTQALLSAIPVPDPTGTRADTRIVLSGDIPNPLLPPSGCAFRTRCFKATEQCAQVEPALSERTGAGHLSACHYPSTIPGKTANC